MVHIVSERAKKLKEIKDKIKNEWKDMPEYKFTAQKPIRSLTIKFKTIEDLKKFEELLGQEIRPNVNTYWYPENPQKLYSNLVYIDEKDES